MTPTRAAEGREVPLEKGVGLLVSHPSLSSLGSRFPTLQALTRALKGSFLVMSSSSEDRESISRSMLLTFSLGYRTRGQSTTNNPPNRAEVQGG